MSLVTNVELEIGEWKPATEEGKAVVREELERLLADPQFSHSKRYPPFLRFVVLRALENDSESYTERSLGSQVFGKSPDYDTATDPVVRVTATEIRKRLMLYYQRPENQNRIRIDLPPGAYSPKFHISGPAGQTFEGPGATGSVQESVSADGPRESNPRGVKLGLWVAVAVLTASAILTMMHVKRSAESKDLWGPLLASERPILFCLPDQQDSSNMILQDASDPRHQSAVPVNRDVAAMADLPALVNMTGIAQLHQRTFHLKGTNATSLDDLREGPSVLIGSFSNPWTLRLTENLRFHFANDSQIQELRIVDSENPANTSWTRSHGVRGKEAYYADYAILARFSSPDTGQYVVVVAGLGHGGTIAAGELAVSQRDIGILMKQAPHGWSGQGVEAVLKTSVVGDQAGPPYVVATHFW